jgi:hypothetical protein
MTEAMLSIACCNLALLERKWAGEGWGSILGSCPAPPHNPRTSLGNSPENELNLAAPTRELGWRRRPNGEPFLPKANQLGHQVNRGPLRDDRRGLLAPTPLATCRRRVTQATSSRHSVPQDERFPIPRPPAARQLHPDSPRSACTGSQRSWSPHVAGARQSSFDVQDWTQADPLQR